MRQDGFSILEALVAIAIVTMAAVSLAQALAASSRVNAGAAATSTATLLAVGKMEQLESLDWSEDALQLSPPGTLLSDTPGYVEYVDVRGAVVGATPAPTLPAGTMYVNRWSVAPAPAAPGVVVLQVVVTRWPDRGGLTAVRITAARTRWGS